MSTVAVVALFFFGGIIGALVGGALTWFWSKSQSEGLVVKIAELKKEQEADTEKLQWLDKAQAQLEDVFRSLSSQVLQSNTDTFLQNTESQVKSLLSQMRGDWTTQKAEMQNLVSPLENSLAALAGHIRDLEQKREGAYQGLEAQIKQLLQAHLEIYKTTTRLTQSLKSSSIRGHWGELQLQRVVEMAGMVKHVDFLEQVVVDGGRPDMIVYLPNGGVLPLDAKAPMTSYFEALETQDADLRKQKFQSHVQAIRGRARELSQKQYWAQFDKAPEFVVMFIPNEACLHAAFENEPILLEETMRLRVLITTPVTLLALLKAVAHGWQQYHLAENARQIAEEGKSLHKRLSTFVGHLDNLGDGLRKVVEHYNKSVASFERRVMPSVRRFEEMDIASTKLPGPQFIEQVPALPDTKGPFVNNF
jgi:DNA recombination protein RmuC